MLFFQTLFIKESWKIYHSFCKYIKQHVFYINTITTNNNNNNVWLVKILISSQE